MDVNAIREGLAKNLQSIPTLQNASGFFLSNPSPPGAHIIPGPALYHEASQDGDDSEIYRVELYVAYVSDKSAQRLLGEYLNTSGEKSVKQALEQKQPGSSHKPLNMPDDVYAVVVLGHEGQQEFIPSANSNVPLLGTVFAVNVRSAPET